MRGGGYRSRASTVRARGRSAAATRSSTSAWSPTLKGYTDWREPALEHHADALALEEAAHDEGLRLIAAAPRLHERSRGQAALGRTAGGRTAGGPPARAAGRTGNG